MELVIRFFVHFGLYNCNSGRLAVITKQCNSNFKVFQNTRP
jgi:hypothetical protein